MFVCTCYCSDVAGSWSWSIPIALKGISKIYQSLLLDLSTCTACSLPLPMSIADHSETILIHSLQPEQDHGILRCSCHALEEFEVKTAIRAKILSSRWPVLPALILPEISGQRAGMHCRAHFPCMGLVLLQLPAACLYLHQPSYS